MTEAALELAVPAGARGLLNAIAPERPRAARLELAWYMPDSAQPEFAVEERHEGRGTLWRLLRIRPAADGPWLPGQPAELLAQAPSRAGLAAQTDIKHIELPAEPYARLAGRRRSVAVLGVRASLLQGTLTAGGGSHMEVRLLLEGPGEAVAELARRLAASHGLSIPRQVLAAGLAPPRRLGAATLRAHGDTAAPVADAFVHAAGHLLDVMLHHLASVGTGVEPEPVHQARVALRRLRSVIRLFQPALDCPELTEADSALRDLARLLGPARDWDVFLGTTAPAVARAFADEPALNRLRAAAQRRRQDAYAALAAWLRGPEPARLGVELACLLVAQPWERTAAGGAEAHSLRAYAAHALRRRARRLKRTDADLSDVPIEALHALRLHAKRLRYACEVFAPLFPGRHAARMIRRLSALQEALGHLNDGAVAGALMAELGPAGRGHGGGLVRGYVAGHQAAALAPAQRAWQRLRALEPFWM